MDVIAAIKTWSPILVPILTLLAGSGWLRYFLDRRTSKQERCQGALEGFLLPLSATLKTTQEVFAKLTNNKELTRLEFHPSQLQQYFASLPQDDPRKELWSFYIDWLQRENRSGLNLVNSNYGRIVLDRFREACDEYRKHVEEWELIWKALKGSGPIPASANRPGVLYAVQFPSDLEPALQAEIEEVKRCGRL
jgi:hypothetical protein